MVILSACAKSDKKKVVLQVGNDKMTLEMVEERINNAPSTLKSYLNTSAGRKQFIDLLSRERAVVEAARQKKYDKRKDYKEAVEGFEKDQKKQFEEYKESLLVELFIKDLHEQEISSSDDEIEKYYQEHEAEYKKPLEIKARHILLATREDAEKALSRIKSGENFGKVARELSIDPISSSRGGEIGPFRKGDLIPEFEKVVFPLKKGKISDVVETQFGYHIIEKISEKVLPERSLEDARDEIIKVLEKNKFDAWLELVKERYNMKIDNDAIAQIPFESESIDEDEMGAEYKTEE